MDIGDVQSINIDQEMRSSYLDYAMSVIVARALSRCPGWTKTCPPPDPVRHA